MNTRIRTLRKTLGLSQTEFGERIGLRQASVSCMERASFAVSEKTIEAICAQFGVNEAWLRTGAGCIFWEDEKKRQDFLALFDRLDPALQEYLINITQQLVDAQSAMLSRER